MTRSPAAIEIVSLARPAGPLWAEALSILRASFPDTLLPVERLAALAESGRYALTCAVASGGALAGVAVTADLAAARARHLDYLATAPAHRGRGVATALLREAAAAAPPGFDVVTLEVDASLVDFYRRRGARLLAGVPYVWPAPDGRAVPMLLMAGPAGRDAPALGPALEAPRVAVFLADLYAAVHARPADDPRLARMLAELAACDSVRLA